MSESDKKAWIKALRSGKYKQTKEHLCTVDPETLQEKFCCLGVAIDALTAETWELDPEFNLYGVRDSEGHFCDLNTARLPDNVAADLGLDSEDLEALITMNDRGRKKFTGIAAWIEKNIPTYNPRTKAGQRAREEWLAKRLWTP